MQANGLTGCSHLRKSAYNGAWPQQHSHDVCVEYNCRIPLQDNTHVMLMLDFTAGPGVACFVVSALEAIGHSSRVPHAAEPDCLGGTLPFAGAVRASASAHSLL